MPSSNVWHEPIFHARFQARVEPVSWPALLVGLYRGDVTDLPAAQLHQRPQIVLHAAIWLGAAMRHGVDPSDVDALRDLIVSELGENAGRLAASPSEIAFYQPAIRGEAAYDTWNTKTIDSVDAYFGAVGHETKGFPVEDAVTPEHAIFAHIAGTQRIFVKDNPNSALWGLPIVTPLDASGSIGFEVRALADAYAHIDPSTAWKPKPSFADHMVWARTWDLKASPLMPSDVGWPFVDTARPTRIVVDDDGKIGFRQLSTTARQVAPGAADSASAEAHPGCAYENGVPFRLTKRGFNPRVAHALLFGHSTPKTDNVARPWIVNNLPEGTKAIRLSGVAYDQGKTIGVVDETVDFAHIERERGSGSATLVRKQGREADALMRRASEAHVAAIAKTRSVLSRALAVLYRSADRENVAVGERIKAVCRDFDGRVRRASLENTFDVIAEGASAQEIKVRAAELCTRMAHHVFEDALTSESLITEAHALAAANAANAFRGGLRTQLWHGIEDKMPVLPDEPAALVRRSHAFVNAVAAALDNERAKQLRGNGATATGFPAFTTLLAEAGAPDDWLNHRATMRGLQTLCVSMAYIPPPTASDEQWDNLPPLGAVLAQHRYPEARLATLMRARDDTLHKMVTEIRNYLEPRISRVDWRDIGVLLLADARDDTAALDHARRKIAQTFAKTAAQNQPSGERNASAQTAA